MELRVGNLYRHAVGGGCVSEYSTVGVLHAGAGSVRGAACARAAVPVAGELGVADDRRCAAWDGVWAHPARQVCVCIWL